MRRYILLLVFLFYSCYGEKNADLIVFSYDRPMQLYALLESLEYYVYGLGQVHVICRFSSQEYMQAYRSVFETFAWVICHEQGAQAECDFKDLTLHALAQVPSDYILFAVDDIVVTDYIDIPFCISVLDIFKSYGVYFRLGTHLTYCYPVQAAQSLPNYEQMFDDICRWKFKDGVYDWNYPHTVDMTLYRKSDVEPLFQKLSFYAPNSLEGQWALHAHKIIDRYGLFFGHAKIVNIPLNRVQHECPNIHMKALSPQELLHLFNDGLKIDIHALYRYENNAAHMAYLPSFIPR